MSRLPTLCAVILALGLPARVRADQAHPAAALLPGGYRMAVAADLAAFRAAGPEATVNNLLAVLGRRLSERGVRVDQVQQVAAAGNPAQGKKAAAGVVLVDPAAVPDPAHALAASAPLQDASYHGLHYSSVGARGRGMVQLPQGPLALASQSAGLPPIIDLYQGKGSRPLLGGDVGRLLARAGRTVGTVLALFARLTEEEQRQMVGRGLPAAPSELALALNPATEAQAGELRIIGRVAGPGKAAALAQAVRQQVASFENRPEVLMLGFGDLVRAVVVESQGDLVTLKLPLPRDRYVGLLATAATLAPSITLPIGRSAPQSP